MLILGGTSEAAQLAVAADPVDVVADDERRGHGGVQSVRVDLRRTGAPP